MKKYLFSSLIALLLASLVGTRELAYANSEPAMKILSGTLSSMDAVMRSTLNNASQDDMLTVIVTLRQQADLSRVNGADRAARQHGVIRALQAVANANQIRLRNLLETRKTQGSVEKYESLWVFNGLSVTATASVINELAGHPDVFLIAPDDLPIVPALGSAEPNLALVNAPALWSMGYSGQGVVIANMDSGVDVNHPDLSTRWRGGSNSWFDPYGQHPATPVDLTGHGTQTMGVMVGGDAGGTSVGVAPGARWIAVKIFNDAGSSTATAIHQGFQWLLDPDGNPNTADAPNVVNNSWTFAYPGCNLDFEPDLESLRAAGILPVFAAGNGGPSSSTSYSPSNNPAAFAVGAINNSSQIYTYGSRGPTNCGGSAGPFPELVAPGVNIHTTDLYGGYYNVSGTSLASPHVAGGLALLLSAHPNLSAQDQQNALTGSAVDLGSAGPDDTYGYGRLDILAAFNSLASLPTSTPLPAYTATSLPTFTSTPLPTMTPTSAPATSIHVGDLDRSSVSSGTKWNGTATILVHNNNHQPVSGATVYGVWTNGATGSASCVTNSSGLCSITKTGLKATVASITFTVTNIARTGITYQSSVNHDPDGESNGTFIIITKP